MNGGKLLREFRIRIDPEAPTLGSYSRLPRRRGKRVTQEELAEAIGVSRVWYSLLESSAQVRPSTQVLDRVADTLMVTRDERAILFQSAFPEITKSANARATVRRSTNALETLEEIEETARALWHARCSYHAKGTASELSTRSRVVASWDRCRALGIDPHRKAAPYCGDIAERRTAAERLLRAAEPVVSSLSDQCAGTGYVVALADKNGTVLTLRGDVDMLRRLAQLDIEAGGDWSEAGFGTNAIGTAAADRRPVQLFAAEHFCEGATGFTCTAAPIFMPAMHEVAGVLDVSAPYQCVRPDLLGFVAQAAFEIEERLDTL